jgi:hypothetical protein
MAEAHLMTEVQIRFCWVYRENGDAQWHDLPPALSYLADKYTAVPGFEVPEAAGLCTAAAFAASVRVPVDEARQLLLELGAEVYRVAVGRRVI